MNDLDFPETCLIYPTTVDGYGKTVLGAPVTVPCMYLQTTAYQHGSSQDSVVGTPRIALPGDADFLVANNYRLEEMVVEINPFGAAVASQRFKVSSVTPARDVLLDNEVRHVECDLKKIEVAAYVG